MISHEFSGDQTASNAVIEAVAAVSDTDPLELPPLYEAVDPEVLDALFEHGHAADSDLRVTFSYNGFTIAVRDGPHVTVQEK